MSNFQNSGLTPAMVSAQIQKGALRPHTMLTNMAFTYFQDARNYFAKSIFPICRVSQSSDNYYKFSKEDLLRDGWQRKPEYGVVMPSVVSENTGVYNCRVDQMTMGISQIRQTDLMRRQGPAIKDPRQQRVRTLAEQANIHQDRIFASQFFKTGVWSNEYTGVDSTSPTTGQFIKFSNDNSDPVRFIDERKVEIHQQTGRTPNRVAMGVNVLTALKNHPGILDRVKYNGSPGNPASVTEAAIAQLFGVDEVVVMRSIYNAAKQGADADMQYIGDPNALLLAYATDSPSVDEPSAGYIFTWDMLGDGQILPIFHHEMAPGVHGEMIEGLMAMDMRITAKDLAIFCADVV